MKRPLQVYLDASEHDALDAWARARGWTKSQAIRVAVRALVRPAAEEDPLLSASGMIVEGLPVNASARFDDYLDATFVAERPPGYGRGGGRGGGTRPRR